MTADNGVDVALGVIGHNWLVLVTAVIVAWLLVTRLVETSESAARLLGPLGRRIAESYRQRSDRYRADVSQEARLLAAEIVPRILPQDYEVVKRQLHNVIDRISELELENSAMRGFIVADEQWHFHERLARASHQADGFVAAELPARIGWETFLERWKSGWRPDVG